MSRIFTWWRKLAAAEPAVLPVDLPGLDEPESEDTLRERVSPLAAPLHIHSAHATVRTDNGVVTVERRDGPAFERPIELVASVQIHGPATITSPCIAALMRQGTPVIWRGVTGYPIGFAMPMHGAGLEARRAQYAAVGTSKGLAIARSLVAAKVINMRSVLRRHTPNAGCLGPLRELAGKARSATDEDRLLGIEGTATALYFAAWPGLMSPRAGDIGFESRTRRPPQDKLNALLSYAYAVLAGECVSACVAAGLDPRQGLYHRPRAWPPCARPRCDGAFQATNRRPSDAVRAQ